MHYWSIFFFNLTKKMNDNFITPCLMVKMYDPKLTFRNMYIRISSLWNTLFHNKGSDQKYMMKCGDNEGRGLKCMILCYFSRDTVIGHIDYLCSKLYIKGVLSEMYDLMWTFLEIQIVDFSSLNCFKTRRIVKNLWYNDLFLVIRKLDILLLSNLWT